MLANFKVRFFLLALVWVATVLAAIFWIGGQRRIELSFAAGPADSETYALATAIAEELNEADSLLHITVFETGGALENMELLEAGQVDLATVQADSEIPEEALGLARLYPDAYHLVVRAGSGIENFADLRGRRVAIPPDASAQSASFWFLADHYGMTADDLAALPMAADAANFAMQQDQVDAVFRVRAPGNPAIKDLIRRQSAEIVSLRQSEAMALKRPALTPGTIPRGSYRGYPPLPLEHLPTVVVDRLLVAHDELPAETVYRLTRAIFEARSNLVARYPLSGFISPLGDDSRSAVPAHPGARRYFDREKPGLLQQNARMASAILYTLVIFGSGLIALRTHWLRARRVRMGDFNKQLMEIAESARSNEDYGSLIRAKHRLMDILGQVVKDLDQDKVSQDEFEHFSFTWQAVDALVRDQLIVLNMPGTSRPGREASV